jgi:hypothetical protein
MFRCAPAWYPAGTSGGFTYKPALTGEESASSFRNCGQLRGSERRKRRRKKGRKTRRREKVLRQMRKNRRKREI